MQKYTYLTLEVLKIIRTSCSSKVKSRIQAEDYSFFKVKYNNNSNDLDELRPTFQMLAVIDFNVASEFVTALAPFQSRFAHTVSRIAGAII